MGLTPEERARLLEGLADLDRAREGVESVKLTPPVPGMFGGSPGSARLFAAVAQAHVALKRDLAEAAATLDQAWEDGYALIREESAADSSSGQREANVPSPRVE